MDRLIVIDDEPELGRFVGRVGESIGFEVKVTTHVTEFKGLIASWKPDVIILDLAMPEADGLEILRWLASQNSKAQIVIMSGFDGRVVDAAKKVGEERGLDIRATFRKPMRLEELKEGLQALKKKVGAPIGEADLAKALTEQELFVLYQPKVSFKTGAVEGVEALVRWRHPTRGVLVAEQFIGLAEQTGLVGKLTSFVMAETIAQHKIWAQQGLDIEAAINLSPGSLHDEQLADHIALLCNAEGTPADRIVIEVTESVVMGNALEALDALTRLRLKGFKLSIDDFGTGFSSLTRLRRLPVTEIKIDQSFVCEMLASPDAFIIVKTVIGLAHNMNLAVVAEGIETPEQYQALSDLGCDTAQGFGISQPLLASEVKAWSAHWTNSNSALAVV